MSPSLATWLVVFFAIALRKTRLNRYQHINELHLLFFDGLPSFPNVSHDQDDTPRRMILDGDCPNQVAV